MTIIRRSNCVPLPIVVCPVVAVVMLESRVASCVHCVENVVWQSQATFSTQCTQHHNIYNRTDNYRQWNAVGSPDDGHKDARNMLRYYWLPVNHYLLHLVGFSFTYWLIILWLLINQFAKYESKLNNYIWVWLLVSRSSWNLFCKADWNKNKHKFYCSVFK